MKKNRFDEKSLEEMVKDANDSLAENSGKELSEEETIEDDAEGGYFGEDD